MDWPLKSLRDSATHYCDKDVPAGGWHQSGHQNGRPGEQGKHCEGQQR